MKNRKMIVTTGLCLLLSVCAVFAQQPALPDVDQEIEKLEKRLAELKQRKREILREQIAALEEELNLNGAARSTRMAPGGLTPNAQPRADATANATNVGEESNGAGAGKQSFTAPPRQLAAPGTGPHGTALPESAAPPADTRSGPAGSRRTQGEPPPQNGGKCAVTAINKSNHDIALCDLAKAVAAENKLNLTRDMGTLLLPMLFSQAVRSGKVNIDARARLVLEAESGRVDKQVGSDDRGMGTTSLAVRGTAPAVLGWAVEHGAAVASANGTTHTFRLNPVGLIEALGGQGYITSYQLGERDPLVKFFRRTSVGLTFDATRGASPPTFIGSKQQLSAVSFRYQFVNQRDPRDQSYQKAWDQFFEDAAIAFTQRQSDVLIELTERGPAPTFEMRFKNKALQSWVEETNAAIAQRPQADQPLTIEEARIFLEERLQQLPLSEFEGNSAVTAKMNSFVAAYQPYLEKKQSLLEEVAKGTLVTFEYTNYREPTAPNISNLRFIMERGTLGGVNLTANASISINHSLPAVMNGGPIKGVKRIRDFNFAMQLDKSLKSCMGLGPCVFAFAGKYQRLTGNAVALDGTELPNTKGDIAVGQVKLTIPISATGLKLPISFTISNRTELVREREVRGNFGLTFDLDTLFARFKPF